MKKIKNNNLLILKKYIYLLIVILVVIISIFNIKIDNDFSINEKEIIVDVKGEVKEEGTYKLKLGSTFKDLLELIELNENADISSFNLNNTLSNKQVIVIPAIKDNHLISINSASLEELMSLKGIGESLANRIIEYREKNNGFKELEDLLNVSGIGEKKFEKIKDYITL